MKIQFLGAAQTVTGSCYLISGKKFKILIDCGLFQGTEETELKNWMGFDFDPAELDAVILTHAHIDHSGRIPLLVKEGFKGPIHATHGTEGLCRFMLPDSGKIQEERAYRAALGKHNPHFMRHPSLEAKKARRRQNNGEEIIPLYTEEDAVDSLTNFESHPYHKEFYINRHIRARFLDAGHILGSSVLELWIDEGEGEEKFVFSGDLGNAPSLLMKQPHSADYANYLVVESTYGNRLHDKTQDKKDLLAAITRETLAKGGKLVIPAFSVGRTQELLFLFNNLLQEKKIPFTKVYLDSPMSLEATRLYEKYSDQLNTDIRESLERGDNPFDFPGLIKVESQQESIALNRSSDPCVIISSSGMITGGRVKYHVKNVISGPQNTILFVGYQGAGTKGRRLLDGAKTLWLQGDEMEVNARIEHIESFSAHADQEGVLGWISRMKKVPDHIFLVHGEEESLQEFSRKIQDRYDVLPVIAEYKQEITLRPTLE